MNRFFLEILLQATLLLGITTAAVASPTGLSVRLRHALALGAFILALLLPLVAWLELPRGWTLLGSSNPLPGALLAKEFANPHVEALTPAETPRTEARPPALLPAQHSLQKTKDSARIHDVAEDASEAVPRPLFSFLLATVSCLLLLRLVVGHFRLLGRLRRSHDPDPALLRALAAAASKIRGLRALPRIRVLDGLGTPAAAGLFRPVILWPARLHQDQDERTIDALLMHELCHLRRNDVASWLVVQLVRILYWPVPFAWTLGRALERDRELLTDADAIRAGTLRTSLATALLENLNSGGATRAPRELVLSMASSRASTMKQRLDSILSTSSSQRLAPLPRRQRLGVLLVVLGVGAITVLTGVWARTHPEVQVPPVHKPEKASSDSTSEPVKSGLLAALDWLVRNQRADGSFEAPRQEYEPGVTALAALALLRAPSRSPTQDATLTRALEWIVKKQGVDGRIGAADTPQSIYSQAIGTLALCEALGSERREVPREAAKRALEYCLTAQNPYKAWRYGVRPGDNDSSVTCWMLMALKSATDARLSVPKVSVNWALDYLEEVTDQESGRTGYLSRGQRLVHADGIRATFDSKRVETVTAMALSARLKHGQSAKEHPIIEKGFHLLLDRPPIWEEAGGAIDFIYWYFGSLAAFQAGGDTLEQWRKALVPIVLGNQTKDGPNTGSFEPVDVWQKEGGRIYATALLAQILALELRLELRPK